MVTTWNRPDLPFNPSQPNSFANVVNIFAAIVVACVVVWLIFKAGPKAVKVSQDDSYAAGAAVPRDKYHYTVDFYNPLYRILSPYLRDFVDEFYTKLAQWIRGLGNGVRRIYTGDVGYYVIYIVAFLAFIIFVQVRWKIW